MPMRSLYASERIIARLEKQKKHGVTPPQFDSAPQFEVFRLASSTKLWPSRPASRPMTSGRLDDLNSPSLSGLTSSEIMRARAVTPLVPRDMMLTRGATPVRQEALRRQAEALGPGATSLGPAPAPSRMHRGATPVNSRPMRPSQSLPSIAK